MLIYLTLLIYHLVVTYKTLSLYAREKPILKEYELGKGLAYCVLLLPLGMLILLIGPFLNQIPIEASHALAFLCFVPSFMSAKRLGNRLETTGTDRIKNLQEGSSRFFLAAMIGIAIVVLSYVLNISPFLLALT